MKSYINQDNKGSIFETSFVDWNDLALLILIVTSSIWCEFLFKLKNEVAEFFKLYQQKLIVVFK